MGMCTIYYTPLLPAKISIQNKKRLGKKALKLCKVVITEFFFFSLPFLLVCWHSLNAALDFWLMAPYSCWCIYCWQDVYKSTYPGNSLCMFTEIYSEALTVWRQFQRKEDTPQVNFTLGCPDCCSVTLYSQDRQSSSQRWHSTKSRYSVSKSEIYCSGKCAIIPQASFNTTMRVLCALSVRCPSNAVTRFKSNRCTNVMSHCKCTVILESKMVRAKVM